MVAPQKKKGETSSAAASTLATPDSTGCKSPAGWPGSDASKESAAAASALLLALAAAGFAAAPPLNDAVHVTSVPVPKQLSSSLSREDAVASAVLPVVPLAASLLSCCEGCAAG